MTMNIKLGLLTAATLLMTACGGGGGGGDTEVPAPAPVVKKADGLWTGTTGTGRSMNALVLDDGNYWVIYSAANNSAVVAGAVHGTFTGDNGSFKSSDGKDFNFEGLGVLPLSSVAGTYDPKKTFNGQLNYTTAAGSVPFNATYNVAYDKAATQSAISGSYTGVTATNAGTERVTFTVSSTGTLSGTGASGCSFTGSVTPKTGVGAYKVTVTYRGGVCVAGTSTQTGAAYFDTPTSRLFAAGLNTSRSDGFLFVGDKASSSSTGGSGSSSGSSTGFGSGSTTVTTGASTGCGSRGGPGYRLRNGNCASWADYYAGRR
ncbi:MAG: hypothetical protein EOO27_21465 [Comamonadaceae bacterium]|nr:MAG: hypothetical protein EOO27_21465 [Comamonadaceae bacterium]